MEAFEKELTDLINRHSIENEVDMPDFLLAGMICRMIEALGPIIVDDLKKLRRAAQSQIDQNKDAMRGLVDQQTVLKRKKAELDARIRKLDPSDEL